MIGTPGGQGSRRGDRPASLVVRDQALLLRVPFPIRGTFDPNASGPAPAARAT